MLKHKITLAYILLVGLPLLSLVGVLQFGNGLTASVTAIVQKTGGGGGSPAPLNIVLLVLQIGVILLVSRLVGLLFRRIRQPQVIGEMFAGIFLGPSLLGWVMPEVSQTLFPAGSMAYLSALSQVGLVLFMFLVGFSMDPKDLRGQGESAVLASHAGIVTPFCLGSILALYLYPRLAASHVSFVNFALFMGAAMSITAFPVLARILAERNLLNSRMGTMAIACAAVDDVSGWCILSYIVALVRADNASHSVWVTVGGSVLYVVTMLFGVRRFLPWFESHFRKTGRLSESSASLMIALALASAIVTEWLGIHLLFGAFLMGAIMPKEEHFVKTVLQRLETLTVVVLLPLFFAFSGLRTSIGTVKGGMWLYVALIIAVAIAGKFGGSTIAARMSGSSWRDATSLGVLMNTRGLMELIALNIGLDIGVITPTLFTMLVIMALVTTFMTSPLLELIYPRKLALNESEVRIDPHQQVA